MDTAAIQDRIRREFTRCYKGATPFYESGPLWDFCMDIVSDKSLIKCMVTANDLGVPPVKTLLYFYEKRFSPPNDFSFTANESRYLGDFMGFLFQFVLGYQKKHPRCQVQRYGVKTASRFSGCPSELVLEAEEGKKND